MTLSCFPANEDQLQLIVRLLTEAGLFNSYEEQARGESIMVSVHTRTFHEREKVKAIFRQAGITELSQSDENAA